MKRFRSILFAKSQEHNKDALACAVALARNNEAGLTFLETSEEIPDLSIFGLPNETVERVKLASLEEGREGLSKLKELSGEEVDVEFQLVEGIRFLTIIQEVLRGGHDLVIKSAEGGDDQIARGLVSRLFSTDDMHLLRKCPCPLWLVKPGGSKTIRRIVAAVDFDLPGGEGRNSALNKQILEMAISLAHDEGAELHVVHAWQAIGEAVLASGRTGMPMPEVEEYVEDIGASRRRLLADLMEQAGEWVGQEMFDAVKPVTHAIKGVARWVIVDQTRALDADLLVMGTVGRIGIPGFFIGNTAESILNRVDCSVLAVKPAGFKSPVKLP